MGKQIFLLAGLVVLLVLGLALPVLAQDETPPDQLYPALQDLSRRLGKTYTPTNIVWSWTADEKYPTSALGCPLITGQPITPVYGYIFTLQELVTGVTYEYRVSADRLIVVPCEASLLGTGQAVTVGADSDGDYIPDVYDACPNALGHESTSGCPYPAIANDADHDLVQENGADLCPTQFGLQSLNGCPPGVAASVQAPAPAATGQCSLSAGVSGYANVRDAASVTANQVNTIYGTVPYPVQERSGDGLWYKIDMGWVSGSVIQLYGNCSTVAVNTSVALGQPTGACQVSPAYVGYANVREWAAYDGKVVAVMRGSVRYTVNAFNYDPATGNWYVIDMLGGWVNERDVWKFGNCDGLPVR